MPILSLLSWPLSGRAALAALGLALGAQVAPAVANPTGTPPVCALAQQGTQALGAVRFTKPSGWLPPETLQAIATAHEPCLRDVPSVEAVIEAVNAAYEDAGADLAFADFGGLDGQTVLIDLVEVRFGSVRIEGAETTNPDYLRARIGVTGGELVDLDRLEARVTAISELDGIDVAADLEPGQAPGTTDVILRVTEPPQILRTITIDGLGPADTGRVRVSAALRIASLTGVRDPLTISLSASEGTRQVALDYSRPIGADGLRFSIGFSGETARAVNAAPPGNGLETRGRVLTFGLSYPLVVSTERLHLLTASVSGAKDESDLAGVALSDLTTREVAFGSSHQWRFPGRGVVGLSHALRLGEVDDNVLGGTQGYARYDGTAFGILRLAPDWTLGGEARWQMADGPLPAFARFSTLGRSGVRGYAAASGTDDAGWLARAELRRSQTARGAWLFSPFAFVDAGRGASFAGSDLVWGPVRRSAGIGLDIDVQPGRSADPEAQRSVGPGAIASIVLAVPFDDVLPRVQSGDPVLAVSLTMRF